MQQTITDSGYLWFRLALMLLVACVTNAGMWAVIVIMPAVEAEFATTLADATLPHTLKMNGFALGNFFIGRAVDRFGVRCSSSLPRSRLWLVYASPSCATPSRCFHWRN